MSSFDPAHSRRIAQDAAHRLVQLIDGDGRFLYRYDALSGAAVDDYNLTRHAGAIWAAALAARRLPARDLAEPLNRAMAWMTARYLDRPPALGFPVIAEAARVELGCVALSLLALIELHRLQPDPGLLGLAREFGGYILSQARPDGGFHHRLLLPSLSAADHTARYATAQSILALANLYRETGERRFLDCALARESELAGMDFGVREHGHWVLYAIEALGEVAPDPAHRAHADRIAAAMTVYTLYRNDGLSNPLACHSEALGAYLRLLRQASSRGEAPSPMEAQVRRTLEENLSLLLDYRLPDGGFFEGEGLANVQIDHIQHALGAYLAHALLYEPAGGGALS